MRAVSSGSSLKHSKWRPPYGRAVQVDGRARAGRRRPCAAPRRPAAAPRRSTRASSQVAASAVGDGTLADGSRSSQRSPRTPGRAVGDHEPAQPDGRLGVQRPEVGAGQQAHLLLEAQRRQPFARNSGGLVEIVLMAPVRRRPLRAGQAARLDSAHAHAPHRLARDARPRRRRLRQQRRSATPAPPRPPRRAAGSGAVREGQRWPCRRPGTLTVGTDKPAYPPYFEDDDPTNGKGFESAVAYAVAKQLGFAKDEVKWTVVPFNSSYAPGPEEVRLRHQPDLDHAAARQARRLLRRRTSRRRRPWSRSKGSPAASATSLADAAPTPSSACRSARRASTRSNASIKPSQPAAGVQRLQRHGRARSSRASVDAIVVDLPTAFYLTAAQVPNAKIVGQFAAPGGDKWGLLLQKGSKLTPCVNQAIAKLQRRGELKRLQEQWMGGGAARPSCS